MNEKRRLRTRRLLLAATFTSGALAGVAACSSEKVMGSIIQDGYDGGYQGGGIAADSGYEASLGPDGFAGVAPGDAAYDAGDAAADSSDGSNDGSDGG